MIYVTFEKKESVAFGEDFSQPRAELERWTDMNLTRLEDYIFCRFSIYVSLIFPTSKPLVIPDIHYSALEMTRTWST